MKRFFFIILVACSFANAFGQSEEAKEKVNKAKDRFVFNINYNLLLSDKDAAFSQKGFSGGFDTYFMYDIVIKDSPISIAPGVGVGIDNYRINSRLQFTDSSMNFVPFDSPIDSLDISYKSSKLSFTYFDVPLEIRFRSKPNKKDQQWKLAAGFKIGFMLGSRWKYKGNDYRGIRQDTDETIQFKEKGLPDTERLRYGVTARGGYGPFNLHFYYSLSDLFNSNSVQMSPITFGLSINGL
ncbi:MAG: PorT family protein [Bacteroidetes bacterium]|nr:PorT family protein [Bacteroidota bacterium]